MMKTCRVCNEKKSDFATAKANRDGRSNRCKSCDKAYLAKYFVANKEKILSDQRVRSKKEYQEDPQKKLASNRRWRGRNPGRATMLKKQWRLKNPVANKAIEKRSDSKRNAKKRDSTILKNIGYWTGE